MLINLRNALMTGKRLPYDAEVEYLEGTGTQWIDTGIDAFSWPYLEITCKVNSNYNADYNRGIMGNSNGGSRWQGIAPNGNSGVLFRGYDDITTISESVTSDFTTLIFDGPNRTAYAGQTSATLLSGRGAGNGYGIWAYVGRVAPIAMSVVSVKIGTSRDNLLFDGIPVRKGTVGYLYDRVSGKLFGNAGTGDFVLGPDVVPVEYIESHGTEWINTGIFASACDEVELSFAVRTTNFRNYIFGCNSSEYGYVEVSSGNKFKTEYASTYNISPLTLYKATFKKSDFSVLVNGTTLNLKCGTSSASLFSRDANFAISCTAADGKYRGKMLIYEVKLSSNSQTLRSFRPVRVGTEGAMMDTLTRRIYRNAWTGAFTYGNDLKYPIPAE